MHLLIDNYDSFTYNIAQALGELGAPVEVFRNDEIDVAEAESARARFDHHLAGPRHARRRGHLGRADPATSASACRSSASAWATSASRQPSAGRSRAPTA